MNPWILMTHTDKVKTEDRRKVRKLNIQTTLTSEDKIMKISKSRTTLQKISKAKPNSSKRGIKGISKLIDSKSKLISAKPIDRPDQLRLGGTIRQFFKPVPLRPYTSEQGVKL